MEFVAYAVAYALLRVGVAVVSALISTRALVCVWLWFLVPHFGLAPLPMKMAWGIDMFLCIIMWPTIVGHAHTRQRLKMEQKGDTERQIDLVMSVGGIFETLSLLGIAYGVYRLL